MYRITKNLSFCYGHRLMNHPGQWINETLDHNMLLHKNDPVLPLLQEAGERLMVVDEHPTAEFLAKLIYNYVSKGGFPVTKVSVWETDSSSASYSPA